MAGWKIHEESTNKRENTVFHGDIIHHSPAGMGQKCITEKGACDRPCGQIELCPGETDAPPLIW